jgi:hypothetical protein
MNFMRTRQRFRLTCRDELRAKQAAYMAVVPPQRPKKNAAVALRSRTELRFYDFP